MKRFTVAAMALSLAACATTPSPESASAQQPREEKEYRTGSRLPIRDPVASSPTTTTGPSTPGAGGPQRTY